MYLKCQITLRTIQTKTTSKINVTCNIQREKTKCHSLYTKMYTHFFAQIAKIHDKIKFKKKMRKKDYNV